MISMEKFSASIPDNWLKNSQNRLQYNEANKEQQFGNPKHLRK